MQKEDDKKEDNKKVKTKKEKKNKPKYNMWQNSWFMIRLAWKSGEKKVLVLCVLAALFAVMNDLIGLYISPTILGVVERQAPISELLLTIGILVGGMMFTQAGIAYVNANTLFGRVALRRVLIDEVNMKAATTSYPNVDNEYFRKLLNKSAEACGSNDKATEAIWNTLTILLGNTLGVVFYIHLITSVHPLLAVVILISAVIGYLLNKHADTSAYKYREEEADSISKITYLSGIASNWSAAKDIRIFGLRSWFEELMDKSLDAYIAFQKKVKGTVVWAKCADILLTFIRNGVAYAYLIHQVIAGEISAAEFLLFFTAAGNFTKWVSGILNILNTLHQQSIDLCTVRECLDFPEPFVFEKGEPLEAIPGESYEIRLENVTFRYPGAEQDALSNINLTLHPGEKLAVVGLNGAGKTTLVKLLCGFLDPTEGRILLNNKDIRDYNRQDYYRMFSAVFQTFSLFAGTIATNVAQSDTPDLKRVKECVEKAGLKTKIESLPQGYETYLNRTVYEDATMLSGGETQRLMLARALYKDAPFLILDEPTAALDPIAESEMYQKYNEMSADKSSVYISHRLASTRFCDRIVFIDNAKIAEEGTHAELLSQGGKYAELFAVQSKYYQEGESSDDTK